MPKLIFRIAGGLGNQIFIYATAKAMALKSNADLVLDTQSGFRRDKYQRHFALQCFDVQYKEANALERFDFPAGRGLRYLIRKANQYLPWQHRFYLVEKADGKRAFMPEMISSQPTGRVWLEGYWQSPLYFEDIREVLQKELVVRKPLSSETQKVAEQIRMSNSVCIHLRLARNLANTEVKPANKQLDEHYFARSMEYIAQRLGSPRFFCFSDNPVAAAWARSLPHDIQLVSHNKGDAHAYEDFYLMSLCHHFILSNSTFGWWPAWLNIIPDNIVISPPLHFWDNQDILPSRWITFDSINTAYSSAV